MIRTFMTLGLLSVWAVGVSVAVAASADVPGPREPLTTSDFGLYGGWNNYFLQSDNGFDFLIMQARVPKDLETSTGPIESHGQAAGIRWNDQLMAARKAGKRVIADIGLSIKKTDVPIETLKRQLDYFMAHVDRDQLYAITLAEENIYWNGNLERQVQLYHYAKSKYNIPVYQWFSPYAGTPGFGWPALPADGWMLDEYAHLMPDYERFIREYKMTRVPLISIVWAAPSMKSFPWKGRGDIALGQQWKIHEKYGIPSSFFCWSGKGNVWSWNPDAPELDRRVFAEIKENIRKIQQQPVKVDPNDWDQPQPSAVPLTCQLQPTATFQEDYTKSGGHLVRSAGLTGFRHLRYRGKGVEFAPDAVGPAHASIVYKLQHPFAPRTFDVRVNAAAAKGADVKLALSISGDGKQWSSPVALDSQGAATMNVPGNDPALQSEATWVRIDLDGRAERADETLLTIQSLLARETFAPTTPSAIQLKPNADGTVEYETRFDDLSWLHTANIDHPKELTVRPGGIGLAGQKGRSATASLVQEFVMNQPVNLQSLSIQAQANQPDLGAVIQLGVSLDGRKPLVQAATSGRFNKTLSLDAKELQPIGPAQRIYVHLTLTNRAGSKTAPAWIKGLKLEAKAK